MVFLRLYIHIQATVANFLFLNTHKALDVLDMTTYRTGSVEAMYGSIPT